MNDITWPAALVLVVLIICITAVILWIAENWL